jgi:hypothetical protein
MKWSKHMFIGIFFLLLGLSILIKIIFKVEIPLFRIVGGMFLVYLGIKIILGTVSPHPDNWASNNTVIFSDDEFKVDSSRQDKSSKYNVIFGRGVIDLTKTDPKPGSVVEINTIFGEGVVLYDPKVSLKIRANAVFSDTRMPNGNSVNFGSLNYESVPSDENPLHVLGSSVFGSLRFEAKSQSS